MTVISKSHVLIQITCNGCGLPAEDSEGGTWWWYEVDGALAELQGEGWETTDEGHQFCQICAADRVCVQVGHDWEDWWTPAAAMQHLNGDRGDRARRVCRRQCHTGYQVDGDPIPAPVARPLDAGWRWPA